MLLQSACYDKVVSISRRKTGIQHEKLDEIVTDLAHLQQLNLKAPAHDVFCCLGTTIKQAKTREAMYTIDVDYPLAFAELTLKLGAKHFLAVSSMNANAKSVIPYSKMKGELEEKLMALDFPALSIVRPSLLLGNRNEHRTGEALAAKAYHFISPILPVKMKSKLGIEAGEVAAAMIAIARQQRSGVAIYDAQQLALLAESAERS